MPFATLLIRCDVHCTKRIMHRAYIILRWKPIASENGHMKRIVYIKEFLAKEGIELPEKLQ